MENKIKILEERIAALQKEAEQLKLKNEHLDCKISSIIGNLDANNILSLHEVSQPVYMKVTKEMREYFPFVNNSEYISRDNWLFLYSLWKYSKILGEEIEEDTNIRTLVSSYINSNSNLNWENMSVLNIKYRLIPNFYLLTEFEKGVAYYPDNSYSMHYCSNPEAEEHKKYFIKVDNDSSLPFMINKYSQEMYISTQNLKKEYVVDDVVNYNGFFTDDCFYQRVQRLVKDYGNKYHMENLVDAWHLLDKGKDIPHSHSVYSYSDFYYKSQTQLEKDIKDILDCFKMHLNDFFEMYKATNEQKAFLLQCMLLKQGLEFEDRLGEENDKVLNFVNQHFKRKLFS